MARYHSGNEHEKEKALEEILEENAPLVDFVINKYYPSFKKYYQDLRQVGYIGIIEAVPNYDPDKGAPATFFTIYIKHNISEYCNNFVQQITPHYANKIKIINETKTQLLSLGLDITPANISMVSGLRLDVVIKSLNAETMSQQKNCPSESYMDGLMTEFAPGPEDSFEKEEQMNILTTAIQELPNEQREVIIRKYGLFGTEPENNAEISKHTGISVTSIRKYLQKAMVTLKSNESLRAMFPNYISQETLEDNEISLVPESAAQAMMQLLEAE